MSMLPGNEDSEVMQCLVHFNLRMIRIEGRSRNTAASKSVGLVVTSTVLEQWKDVQVAYNRDGFEPAKASDQFSQYI